MQRDAVRLFIAPCLRTCGSLRLRMLASLGERAVLETQEQFSAPLCPLQSSISRFAEWAAICWPVRVSKRFFLLAGLSSAEALGGGTVRATLGAACDLCSPRRHITEMRERIYIRSAGVALSLNPLRQVG